MVDQIRVNPPANGFRALPSVDRLLAQPEVQAAIARYSHAAVVELTREALAEARQAVADGAPAPSIEAAVESLVARLDQSFGATLTPVINATGVVLHTNLGRAPLSASAQRAMLAAAQGYSNLEFDLERGERGSRYSHVSELLRRLVGAEAALVVNNCASAVLLALTALAQGREVIVSRGQAVEIGGAFRVPDVMRQSGSRLVEVGTTNRTYQRDYAEAITDQTAGMLRVHASNFKVIGFTHSASLAELVALAQARGLFVLDDLGSGALLDTARFGLSHEPMAQASVAAGADLVAFSGDKLVGGPQAGLLVGKRAAIDRLRRHPLLRALRVDKCTLAALQATLFHYLKGDAEREIPIWRLLSQPLATLEARARGWQSALTDAGASAETVMGDSPVGGGSLPGDTLPTWLLRLDTERLGLAVNEAARRLRLGRPSVVARVERDRLVFDPRSVEPDDDEPLLTAIKLVLASERAARSS